MRDLDYDSTLQKLFTPGIVATLTQIHEGKGILPIASVTGHDTLEKLNEIAKTRDAGASCRLEGIKVTEKHLRELLDGKVRANSVADKAELGYRSVLETIDNSYSTCASRRPSYSSCIATCSATLTTSRASESGAAATARVRPRTARRASCRRMGRSSTTAFAPIS